MGHGERDETITQLFNDLKGDVGEILATGNAFAVIRISDRSLVTWGNGNFGGSSGDVAAQLKDNIHELHGNKSGFVAITKNDGRLVGWGGGFGRRTFITENEHLTGDVQDLHLDAEYANFLAIRRSTGRIEVWADVCQCGWAFPGFCNCHGDDPGFPLTSLRIVSMTAYPNEEEWSTLHSSDISKIYKVADGFLVVRDCDGKLFAWGRGCRRFLDRHRHALQGDVAAVYYKRNETIVIRNSDGKIYVELDDVEKRDMFSGIDYMTFDGQYRNDGW